MRSACAYSRRLRRTSMCHPRPLERVLAMSARVLAYDAPQMGVRRHERDRPELVTPRRLELCQRGAVEARSGDRLPAAASRRRRRTLTLRIADLARPARSAPAGPARGRSGRRAQPSRRRVLRRGRPSTPQMQTRRRPAAVERVDDLLQVTPEAAARRTERGTDTTTWPGRHHLLLDARAPRATLAPSGPSVAVCAAGGSVELVIAPQAHEIAIEVLAERDDLALEATAQLEHHALVGRLRLRRT